MRIGAGTTASGQGRPCHILDWHCSSLKVVTRSTFASETQAAIAATDSALMLALTMHEIRAGPVTPRQGMTLLQDGGLNFKINLGVDAMNLVSALRNARLRTPSERTMLCQLLWLKELLQKQLLSVTWYDTRDMTADGHTKGSIPRTAINEVADGQFITRPRGPCH